MSETISPNTSPITSIGQYTIVSKLGEGGMGVVYRARDPKLGRDVAIKVLPASLSANVDRLNRFEQEAQAAGALNHPNILSIYHIGTHNGAPYIVSELLEGETLRECLAGGALPRRKATTMHYRLQKDLPPRTTKASCTSTSSRTTSSSLMMVERRFSTPVWRNCYHDTEMG